MKLSLNSQGMFFTRPQKIYVIFLALDILPLILDPRHSTLDPRPSTKNLLSVPRAGTIVYAVRISY